MKKKFVIIALTVALSILIVCFWPIPIGDDIVSETVLGTRQSQDGTVLEQILQVNGLHNYFSVLSPDGWGKWHESFYKFYLKTGENKIYLSHLPFTPQEYDVLQPVLPVENTTKWVAARLSHVERDSVDIELVVFDGKQVHRTLSVKNCLRTSTGRERWNDLFNYGMIPKEGNTKMMFSTKNGNHLFDVTK